MQGPLMGAAIQRPGAGQGAFAVQMAPGLYIGLAAVDALQAGAQQVFGAQRALGQLFGGLAGAQKMQGHGRLRCVQAASR